MTTSVTLELPDEVARRVFEVALQTDRSLEAVLTAWLEEAMRPHAGIAYPVFTPYGNDAAASALLDALAADDAERADTGQQ